MLPQNSERHTMILERTHSSGADEWYCPTCGRRIIIQWPPNYKKIVLEAGDDNAAHSGGKGGLHIGPPEVLQHEQLDVTDEPEEHDPNLMAWKKWMDQVNFESWWNWDHQ